ncbi:unnamed protein product [Symbiodinium microadriaticum]|nr:unnamed protein product [Symbiodinium microadriaticum]CAE7947171.1 unnamed protein product [Symbiodinium sp. KB8]
MAPIRTLSRLTTAVDMLAALALSTTDGLTINTRRMRPPPKGTRQAHFDHHFARCQLAFNKGRQRPSCAELNDSTNSRFSVPLLLGRGALASQHGPAGRAHRGRMVACCDGGSDGRPVSSLRHVWNVSQAFALCPHISRTYTPVRYATGEGEVEARRAAPPQTAPAFTTAQRLVSAAEAASLDGVPHAFLLTCMYGLAVLQLIADRDAGAANSLRSHLPSSTAAGTFRHGAWPEFLQLASASASRPRCSRRGPRPLCTSASCRATCTGHLRIGSSGASRDLRILVDEGDTQHAPTAPSSAMSFGASLAARCHGAAATLSLKAKGESKRSRLASSGIADMQPAATLLFIAMERLQEVLISQHCLPTLTKVSSLAAFPVGGAAGAFIARALRHQPTCTVCPVWMEHARAIALLTSFANVLADGRAPRGLRAYFGGAKGTALRKLNKTTGEEDARPVCTGEVLRAKQLQLVRIIRSTLFLVWKMDALSVVLEMLKSSSPMGWKQSPTHCLHELGRLDIGVQAVFEACVAGEAPELNEILADVRGSLPPTISRLPAPPSHAA